MSDRERNTVLMLSVVHPDYLPSLYALSTVLQRHGYSAHLFCFASTAKPSALWARTNLHVCGDHRGGVLSRWRARQLLLRKADDWRREHHPAALLATCPFTLAAALDMARSKTPVVYLAYETYEVRLREMVGSPLSWLRSRVAFRRAREADLVCVPSAERAGWLLARASLTRAPITVLNCPALSDRDEGDDRIDSETLRRIGTRIPVIHTGRVSPAQATLELIDSVERWPMGSVLVITNVGSSHYEDAVRASAMRSTRAHDIILLPAVSRSEMLALQAAARVGVFLTRDTDVLETLMPAPNKVGEYLHAGLVTVAPRSTYMEVLERHGVAVLVDSLAPRALATAIGHALERATDDQQRNRVFAVARGWYNMDVQAQPIVRFLTSRRLDLPA
jgi:glycosyltransferase involved in cell wall biosynthesis